eukprot:scaffold30011_cov23-Cyclotella_meneghiniana.AAC.1
MAKDRKTYPTRRRVNSFLVETILAVSSIVPHLKFRMCPQIMLLTTMTAPKIGQGMSYHDGEPSCSIEFGIASGYGRLRCGNDMGVESEQRWIEGVEELNEHYTLKVNVMEVHTGGTNMTGYEELMDLDFVNMLVGYKEQESSGLDRYKMSGGSLTTRQRLVVGFILCYSTESEATL